MSRLVSPNEIIKSDLCIGCGICAILAGNDSVKMQFDKYGQLKPNGVSEWLNLRSEIFADICPFSPFAKNEDELSKDLFPNLPGNESIGRYLKNYAGYVTNDEIRLNGSSGGLTTWVTIQLLRRGIVAAIVHVIPSDKNETGKYFKFSISRNEKEIIQGAKSRYYPVELSEVLETIKKVPGRYAIVAIPCMIKGINLLRSRFPLFKERIVFTFGLFCGHMKSSNFVYSFAWQMKVPAYQVEYVEYRFKQPNKPANWYTAQLKLKNGSTVQKDWWHLADGDWGSGFFMNPACNFCDDVVAETADVSFGDAWIEPYFSDGKGTNVIVVRSAFINSILDEGIRNGSLMLEEVAPKMIEQTQAAGLRQRREGLSYRLQRTQKKLQPVKRVKPDSFEITDSRKHIYRLRYHISKWSHRLFLLAKKIQMPFIYLFWARIIASIYYGFAYKKGSIRMMIKRYFESTR